MPAHATTRRTFLTGAAALAAASTATIAAAGRAGAAAWETVLDGSFSSWSTFESNWNYLYPWGSDHNGTARMYGSSTDHNHIRVESGGVLALLATRITWDEGNSSADPHLPIRYHSGAVHAKHQVLVNATYPNYEVRGEFQAPSAPGTWPAFWLTGVNSWPPESDIMEFKGDSRNWFNTFRTSSDVDSKTVTVSDPGSWHEYRAWITMINSTDVEIHYYLDDVWQAAHVGAGFVDQPLWIIYNLQMEGSSGNSGPSGETWVRARNVYVGRSVA
ncbi:glycoside hydrolase family 16 protein [Streptomyces sp. 6N223]|uniref:glycoside hydrolase family 16 protein n=1 Tax=Streptomyces sp. 6N223 TaxID=3457412 RepID=UPI003FD3217E